MTIQEAQAKREDLARNIEQLVNDFEEDTGVEVTTLEQDLIQIQYGDGNRTRGVTKKRLIVVKVSL